MECVIFHCMAWSEQQFDRAQVFIHILAQLTLFFTNIGKNAVEW